VKKTWAGEVVFDSIKADTKKNTGERRGAELEGGILEGDKRTMFLLGKKNEVTEN